MPAPAGSDPDPDRTATFRLVNGLSIYGGFAGGETQLDQRDPVANVTILSGHIDQSGTDDCYHVVTGSRTDSTAVLDGFTITDGHADGVSPNNTGAGLYVASGHPTIWNCQIRDNQAASSANFRCDVNADGAINILDLVIVRNNLNLSVAPCP